MNQQRIACGRHWDHEPHTWFTRNDRFCPGKVAEPIPADTPQTSDWEPEDHEHVWQRRQNVTSSGYAMPPYDVCRCGAARHVDE